MYPPSNRPMWRGHSCPRPLKLKLPLPLTLPLPSLLLLTLLAVFSMSAAAQETPVALKGARLLTITHGTIENGTVIMQGGKITA
ncbi:MAG: hypothetical protein WCC32_11310, partial [Terriglobales bacterium]